MSHRTLPTHTELLQHQPASRDCKGQDGKHRQTPVKQENELNDGPAADAGLVV